jgi:hypothetical protein
MALRCAASPKMNKTQIFVIRLLHFYTTMAYLHRP